MARRQKHSLGVSWHLPAKAGGFQGRPFASTTAASRELIGLLAEDGLTWAEMDAELAGGFDREAREVSRGFVEAGFGSTLAREHVR